VGARVTVEAVPISAALADGASALGVDALSLAISGGEDYELLATMPAGAVDEAAPRLLEGFGVRLSDVGEVTVRSGLVSVDAEGRTSELAPEGWDHFGPG
jgi:thiamine-monophosphate kinase